MKNILVPVGSSNNLESHLQYAVDFAKSFGAKLYVVQVYNVYTKASTMANIDMILQTESIKYLNEILLKVDTKGVEVIAKTLKGDLIDTLEDACQLAEIDLVLIEPKTNSTEEDEFLGRTSGKIVKQINSPVLIVPEGEVFKPAKSILMAIKSAIIKKENALKPLADIKENFKAEVDLLLVKTPFYIEGDLEVGDELNAIITNITQTEKDRTFQGVAQYYESHNPDMLCIVRRKRGFFTKMWEKNVILKKDFSSTIPVLVLSGMK